MPADEIRMTVSIVLLCAPVVAVGVYQYVADVFRTTGTEEERQS